MTGAPEHWKESVECHEDQGNIPQTQAAAVEGFIVRPVAMAFDARRRLWIVEAHSDPQRRPEAEGKDRILIFEGRDRDGKFEERKDFAEKLTLMSGLERGFGGVWIGAAPHLLLLPDRNGDDVPEGAPENVLDGLGVPEHARNAERVDPEALRFRVFDEDTKALGGRAKRR